jgi:isoamylase
MTDADWADAGAKSIALLLSGSLDPDVDDDGSPMTDDDLALLLNAWWEPIDFAVPWATSVVVESDSYDPRTAGTAASGSLTVGPRSLVLVRTARAGSS